MRTFVLAAIAAMFATTQATNLAELANVEEQAALARDTPDQQSLFERRMLMSKAQRKAAKKKLHKEFKKNEKKYQK